MKHYLITIIFAIGSLLLFNSGCKKDTDIFIPYDIDTTNSQIGDSSDTNQVIIFGCMDSLALNYNDSATVDNGTCFYEEDIVWGCMDSLATNYNELANAEDGSCVYDTIVTITGDINNFFEAIQDEPTTYNANNDVYDIVTTPQGTRFICNQGIFVYQNDDVVQGWVELQIQEFYTKGDMIRYSRQTMSDGSLIYSDGFFYVKAYQNGQELKLGQNEHIQIQVSNQSPNEDMELFYGEETEPFNWEWAPDDPNTDLPGVWINEWGWEDTTGNSGWGFGYEIFSTRLDWINCDAFADIPENEKTSVTVELEPEMYTNQNAIVFMVLDDMNSVVQLWGDQESMNFTVSGMPIGEEVTFIAIATTEEDVYDFAMLSTTLENNHLDVLMPVETPLSEIEMILEGL